MLIRPIMPIAALLLPATCGLPQEGFPDKCSGSQLPFDAIKIAHPIDSSCGLEGKTTSKASQVQNLVKNNFCVTASSPEVFTPQMLVELQCKTLRSRTIARRPQAP
jgi:hypothetical protein